MKNKFRGALAWARGIFFSGLAGLAAVACFAFYFAANSFGQPFWMGNSASAAVPLRVVVKFGPRLDQGLARACSVEVTPAGGSEQMVGLNDAFRATPTSPGKWNPNVNSTPAGCSLTANSRNP